jgi:SAM-dependent methyltransferase
LLKLDHRIDYTDSFWKNRQYDSNKSLVENVGLSNHPQIEEELKNTHDLLKQYYLKYCDEQSTILDIGCGVGLYLCDFKNPKRLTGVDLNSEFLHKAKQLLPEATFLEGDYLKLKMPVSYNLIYLFTVMQYIKPSQFDTFVKKLATDLKPGGIVFISYSHALTKGDMAFNDLTYVRYSPDIVKKSFSAHFNIIVHEHFYDKREVTSYDTIHHFYPNGRNDRKDTQRNTYLLVAQKK